MTSVSIAYIGLGANLGDPVQQLVDARRQLLNWQGAVAGRCSSLYLSSPVGYAKQPDFVNCVLELQVRSSALVLFEQIQRVERSLGRQRRPGNRNAPRHIDIDLLLFGEEEIVSDVLHVPHPRLLERLFVLQPLAELLAGQVHAQLGDLDAKIQQYDFVGQHLCRLKF